MQNIEATIEEYKSSKAIIKGRINELSAKITAGCSRKEDSAVKQLEERRMKLYTELWDIEYAIHEMQEYLRSTQDVTENAS